MAMALVVCAVAVALAEGQPPPRKEPPPATTSSRVGDIYEEYDAWGRLTLRIEPMPEPRYDYDWAGPCRCASWGQEELQRLLGGGQERATAPGEGEHGKTVNDLVTEHTYDPLGNVLRRSTAR